MTIIIPDPITKPYCNTGAKVTTPVGSSTTVANQETGFPPLQATPLNAGGIPVDIEQFNGVLNLYSQQIQALVSGAKFTFNQAVSDANGGYPLDIILYCEFNNSYQKSLKANNTFNFVTTPSYIDDGINWISVQSIYTFINNTMYTDNINPSGTLATFGGDIISTSGNITTQIGDITASAGNINGNLVIASTGLTVKNGHKLSLFNVAETAATSFKSYPTATQQDYILPPALPTTSGQSFVSDTSGNTSWINLLGNIGLTYTNSTQLNASFNNPNWFQCLAITIPSSGKFILSGQLTTTVGGGDTIAIHVGITPSVSASVSPPSGAILGDNYIDLKVSGGTSASQTLAISNTYIDNNTGATSIYLNIYSSTGFSINPFVNARITAVCVGN